MPCWPVEEGCSQTVQRSRNPPKRLHRGSPLFSAVGIALLQVGEDVNVIGLCVYGIGAILKSSVFWFTVLKWAGGLYIIWLGIKLWLSPPIVLEEAQVMGQTASSKLFRQGALSAMTNPKSLLLFMAMLPQFINPNGNMFMQFLIIAITYSVTEFAAEYMCVYAASHIRPWLARVGKRFNQGFGGLFVVIGAALPLRS